MTVTTSSTTIHSTSSRMRRRAGLFALYVVCVLLAILFLFPVFWSTLTSVKPPAEASAVPPTYWPSTFTFDNY
ncbi:MAG: hypothetical protein IAE81_01650, partial [Caldilineaceae bacterium]|nr:hypothetical protein [Caldilineaceae bacterium]